MRLWVRKRRAGSPWHNVSAEVPESEWPKPRGWLLPIDLAEKLGRKHGLIGNGDMVSNIWAVPNETQDDV